MVGGSNGIMGLQEYTSAGWEQWGQGWNETWLPSELQRIEMDIPASQLSNTTVRLIFQRNTGSATGSMYCFLDNLVITQYQTEILEENNYYPFGLRHNGYNDVQAGTQGSKFKYNGKELNSELGLDWYDFGARNYDAALGRWMNLDPLAEQMRRHSPYNYAFNNPIFFIDPDGMAPYWKPDSNGDLIAEAGDNAQTLATYLNTTEDKALNMLQNQKALGANDQMIQGANDEVMSGQKVKVDNNMTRSIKNSDGRTLDENIAGDYSKPIDDNDLYNCHDSAKAAVTGEEINSSMDSKGAPSLADPVFSTSKDKQYKNSTEEVDANQAVFGKTVITIGTVHSVTYYGTSNDGTVYVYSKPGHGLKPEVTTLNNVQEVYNNNGNEKTRYFNYIGN